MRPIFNKKTILFFFRITPLHPIKKKKSNTSPRRSPLSSVTSPLLNRAKPQPPLQSRSPANLLTLVFLLDVFTIFILSSLFSFNPDPNLLPPRRNPNPRLDLNPNLDGAKPQLSPRTFASSARISFGSTPDYITPEMSNGFEFNKRRGFLAELQMPEASGIEMAE
ncbi:uncharacterized protein A4U43_C02F7170 [Asparagus officinalis]|uniref:Uncharacterized protein n=1 Tax=Asparagus officinalis TaxID=4686 RepID=A0A5P1FGJ6_ASPOF|nr:uncharacterized protein A4U43_C02F7170 [Asparagus officinalis]